MITMTDPNGNRSDLSNEFRELKEEFKAVYDKRYKAFVASVQVSELSYKLDVTKIIQRIAVMTDPNGLINSKPISEIVNEPRDGDGCTDIFFIRANKTCFLLGHYTQGAHLDDGTINADGREYDLEQFTDATYAPLPINKNYRTFSPCTIQHSTDMVEYDKGFVEREEQ